MFVHRGEPAREPHGAVREQGDRRAAGQGRGPGHGRRDARRAARRRAAAPAGRRRPRGGEGGGAARSTASPTSTPCSAPRCARPARSWASTARSAWRSPRARPARATAAASRARCSCRSPTATRPPALVAARRFAELGFSHRRDRRAPPTRLEANGVPVDDGRREGRRGASGVDAVDLISSGKVDLVVNTPRGRGRGRRRRRTSARLRSCTASRASPPSRPRSPRPTAWPSGSPPTCGSRPLQEHHDGSGDQLALLDLTSVRVDLTTRIGSIELPNPVMTASGSRARRRARPLLPARRARSDRGEVARGLRVARATRRRALHPVTGGMLNSVGLQGPGVAAWLATTCPRSSVPARVWSPASGAASSTTTSRRRSS